MESMEEAIRPPSANPRMPNFPIPERLYEPKAAATMPDPEKQLSPSLSVQLTGAEKDELDVLAAWPLSTTSQLAGQSCARLPSWSGTPPWTAQP